MPTYRQHGEDVIVPDHSATRLGRFNPRIETQYQLYRKLGWHRGRSREHGVTLQVFETRTVQSITNHYTGHAIMAAPPPFPKGKATGEIKLRNRLYLGHRIKMLGAVPPLI